MNNLVKSTIHGVHRVHAPTAEFKPVCGGGNGAKSANWQEDIGGVTCLRCLTILEKRATPPPEKIKHENETPIAGGSLPLLETHA